MADNRKLMKSGGLELTASGFIRNFSFESKVADPETYKAGDMWLNETDGLVKFVTLAGDPLVPTIKVLADLSGVENVQAAVDLLNGDSSTVGSVAYQVQQVIGAAPEALNTIQEIAEALNNNPDVLQTIQDQYTTSINNLEQQILGTASEAMDTLGEVQDHVLAMGTAIGLTANGTYEARTGTNYLNGLVSFAAETLALDVALKALENDLNNKIGDLATLDTTEKATMVGAINELAALVGTGTDDVNSRIDALVTAMNAKKKVYVSASAASEHTFNYGMAGQAIATSVQVVNADGTLTNDLLLVSLDPATTTATISMAAEEPVNIVAMFHDHSDVVVASAE